MDEELGDLVQRYWDDVKKQTEQEYIHDCDAILDKYQSIDDFKSLGAFLRDVNYLCSTFIATKTRLLLYRIQAYPIVTDRNTGRSVAAKSASYDLAIEPFQVTLENIDADHGEPATNRGLRLRRAPNMGWSRRLRRWDTVGSVIRRARSLVQCEQLISPQLNPALYASDLEIVP